MVEGDGYRLEAIATPGHTANHLAFAWPERGMIFSGDHVMGWSTTIVAPPDGSMADYMASLDRLAARPERLYLPAHGGGDPRRAGLCAGASRRTAGCARRRSSTRIPSAATASIRSIVARVYAGLDPALAGAAALSALAHLEDLVARGVVASDGAADA